MKQKKHNKKLPKFLQSALWSYRLDKLDFKKDKEVIISQILNHGTWKQLEWLWQNYSEKEIEAVVKNPFRGFWREDVLNYWSKIFDLHWSKDKIRQMSFSLSIQQKLCI